MPFKTFNSWLFDGKKNSPIPRPRKDDNGKVIVDDILKYNSPITHTFVISLFLRNGSLNHYLDEHFNNIGVRYLTRKEILKFIKNCVIDFRIKKRDIMFYKRRARRMLYDKIRERMPLLKNDDVVLLCDIIEKSDNKDAIFDSLGLEKPKKSKLKKDKEMKTKKITLDDFLVEHFSMIDVS